MGLEEAKELGGIDLSTIELTLSRQGILLEVGIPPSNKIGLAGKDEKFVSSLTIPQFPAFSKAAI